jgi:hypothetical protein
MGELSWLSNFQNHFKDFTPLESPSIPACPALGRDRGRQTGMLGMVEIPAKAGASVHY